MFTKQSLKIYVHLAPAYAGREKEGVYAFLDNMLLKYNPHINGVILTYHNIQFLDQQAKIFYDSPFLHFHISFEALVFSPPVGSQMTGIIDKQSPSHIGLVALGFFNVSISKIQIDPHQFEFHFLDDDEEEAEEEEALQKNPMRHKRKHKSMGYWIHTPTQTKLENGIPLTFTVTNLFTSSGLLCLRGSLKEFTPPSSSSTSSTTSLTTSL